MKPKDINTEYPFIGSKLQNIEAEHCARALVSKLTTLNKSFEDFFTLKEIGNIKIEQLEPLIERDCIALNENKNLFKVTEKFINIVIQFKKK